MPERLVIVNTSPLLYLHLAGCLEILACLYRGVIIPPAVEAELAAGRQAGVETPALNSYPWISIIPVQSVALVSSILDLGPGESEVIALGLEHPESLLIIDDRLARRHRRAQPIGLYRHARSARQSQAGRLHSSGCSCHPTHAVVRDLAWR